MRTLRHRVATQVDDYEHRVLDVMCWWDRCTEAAWVRDAIQKKLASESDDVQAAQKAWAARSGYDSWAAYVARDNDEGTE